MRAFSSAILPFALSICAVARGSVRRVIHLDRSDVRSSIRYFLIILIVICANVPRTWADTILVFRGGNNAIDFKNAITVQLDNGGGFANVYTNLTGKSILDMHFDLAPPDGLVGLMVDDFFGTTSGDPKGAFYDAFKGDKNGILVKEVFTLDIRGLPANGKVTITPTFTGVPVPEPATILLIGAALLFYSLIRLGQRITGKKAAAVSSSKEV